MNNLIKNLINGRKEYKDLSEIPYHDLLIYKSETTYYLSKKSGASLNVPYSEVYENYSELAKEQYRDILPKIRETYDLYFGGELTKDEYLSELENLYRTETKENNINWVIPFSLLVYMFGKWDINPDADEMPIDRLVSMGVAGAYSYYSEHYFEEYQQDIISDLLDQYDNVDDFDKELSMLWEGKSDIKTPGGLGNNPDQYFDSLILLDIARNRIFGSLQAMDEAGITRYRIVEIIDDVTCEFCIGINGTEFDVSDGINLRDRIVSLTDPSDIKEVSNWISGKKLEELMESEGIQGIIDSGLCLPPYHPRCRGVIEPA